jgi:single-stranded-DNA-specific exonuclease
MYLPYVALGTVADVVDLVDENRALVARGIAALRRWSLPGFIALCEAAGIERSRVSTFEIGYVLGPRINAAGRIDDPRIALDLLLADDLATATPLAHRLNDLNERRQADTKRALAEAERMVAEAGGIAQFPAIVLAHSEWSIGIAGLVAGRLAEAYGRPAVILERGDTESRGSARSAGDIDIHQALTMTKELLIRYGGHRAAAGLSLETHKFEQFQRELAATVFDLCGGRLPERVITLDAEAAHDELDLDSVDLLDRMEPFGRGNDQPLLLIRRLRHRYAKTSKDGRHLLFQVIDDYNRPHRAVLFGAGHRLRELMTTPRIDLAANLTRDDWSGRIELKLRVADFRPAR